MASDASEDRGLLSDEFRRARPTKSCVGPRSQESIAAARAEMARLLWTIRRNGLEPEEWTSILDDFEYEPSTALALIRAAYREGTWQTIRLSGRLVGDLYIAHTPRTAALSFDGEVVGSVHIWTDVGGVVIAGLVTGEISIGGAVAGEVTVAGAVGRGVSLGAGARVWGGLRFGPELGARGFEEWTGDVSGRLFVAGEVQSVSVDSGATVGGVFINARRTAPLIGIDGTVRGDVELISAVSQLHVGGHITGDLRVLRSVHEGIHLTGRIDGRTLVTPIDQHSAELLSVSRSQFSGEVVVGDRVSIERCDFRDCSDLGRFQLSGADLFPSSNALANPPANGHPVADLEFAAINRQLRVGLERRSNRPSAGIFYRGEMNARRRAARERGVEGVPDLVVLTGYRLLSGYGLKAGIAAMWFVLVALVGGLLFWAGDLMLPGQTSAVGFFDAFTFSVRSMVSFVSPPSAVLTRELEWLQLALRFAGPLILAQVLLAVRERVKR